MSSTLIYIHGFNSSPDARKAQLTWEYLRDRGVAINFLAPQLSVYPAEAYQQLCAMIEEGVKPVTLIGSSLGGFYATALAEKYDLRAVLINPAVRPWQMSGLFIGEHEQPHTGERYTLTAGHMRELEALDVPAPGKPLNLMVMLQTGDDALDYRQAVEKYSTCRLFVEGGGSHTFEHYERYLPDIMQHLQLGGH